VIDYVERARALAPRIEARAAEIERQRRLPDDVVAALTEAGFFALLLPHSLGGAELDPVAFVQVIEEIAKADASAAWVLCQTSGCSVVAGYLSPDVAKTIFGNHGVLAWGSFSMSAGRAVPVDGGYRVTGSWGFASGGHHATWLGAHCPVTEADGTLRRRADGQPLVRTMLFPASEAPFEDAWDVMGLRGTGSDTYAVSDLFVPREHSVSRDDPAERRLQRPLYCFSTGNFYASGFAAVALGIARRMLDTFVELAQDKTPRGHKGALRDNAVIQSQVARAEAALRSARAFLLGTLSGLWEEGGRVGHLTLEQRVLIRLAATHAIHQAKGVVDAAYHAAGSTAIFTGGDFERRFRDMHAVTQQIQGRQAHFETVGRFMLGLETDTTFL
jgi:alkylation response protein AidB-like acyl-CoA dehydrogenase